MTDDWELLVPPDFQGDVAHYSKPDGEGGLIVRSVQDVEAVIDRNKAARTHNDGYTPDRTMRRVATIPAIVRIKIQAEQGWDPWRPDLYPEKMAQLLNDPDWAFLRTADGQIGLSNGKNPLMAAFANLGELNAAIAKWATKTSLTAQMPQFVAWAHQEICRRLRAPVLYARADVVIAGETAAAPAGFLAARRFYLDVTPRRVLRQMDASQILDMTMAELPADYPACFAVEGVDTLSFAPLFGGSCTGKLLFYKAPDDLVEDDDTNVVLQRYPFLYLFGALEALFRYLEDDNNAQIYGGQFGALIASVNAEEAKDALRGPMVATAGTGAVV